MVQSTLRPVQEGFEIACGRQCFFPRLPLKHPWLVKLGCIKTFIIETRSPMVLAGLDLKDLPASASLVLKLKVCAITLGLQG